MSGECLDCGERHGGCMLCDSNGGELAERGHRPRCRYSKGERVTCDVCDVAYLKTETHASEACIRKALYNAVADLHRAFKILADVDLTVTKVHEILRTKSGGAS